jgi:CXXC-20-CXXC protein
MIKECSNCNRKISFSEYYKHYLLKNRYKFTCPECGTVHKATRISFIISTIIFIGLYCYIIAISKFSLSTNIVLLLIYFLLLQPLIMKYERKDN